MGKDDRVRMSRLLDIIQDACLIQLENCEVSQEFFRRCGATTFIIYWQIDILGEIRYGQEVNVGTFVYSMKKTYGERNVVITDEEGNMLVRAACGGANVHRDSGAICPMPADLMAVYPLEEKLDMEYLPRKIHFPAEAKVSTADTVKVTRSRLDHNGHMNNARYLDICEDLLPGNPKIERFLISYINPAREGDIIVPVIYESAGLIGMDLRREDGGSYARVMFYKDN